MNNLNDMFGQFTDFLKSEAKTETIIGQQFKLGEFTCVPVMSIGLGFGGGGGEGKGTRDAKMEGEGTGNGGAAGIGMRPIGFLVTKDDEIQFVPAQSSKGFKAILDKIPDFIDKFSEKNKKKETEKV